MGNSNDQERAAKERERELQLRSSRLEAHRFEKLKKLLPYMKVDIPIDDFSEETVNQRMCHYFENPNSKYSSSFMKTLVSRKKKRFKNDQFDLDLAYISKRVIAMGFPSKGLESIYRNSREDTLSFMNSYHPTHYRIYNLCEERNRYYRSSLFNGAVSYFPMKDHNPTDLIMMLEFCIDAYLYLSQHEDNVIAVHCKAGKGRTGLMICAYIVFIQAYDDKGAMEIYGLRRTYNGKGLTISSQKRYVSYFYQFLRDNLGENFIARLPFVLKSQHALSNIKKKISKKVALTEINIGPLDVDIIADITIKKLEDLVVFEGTILPTRHNLAYLQYVFPEDILEEQDINIIFKSEEVKFSCWVNTYFFIPCEKLSRELPKMSNFPQVGCELKTNELDKFKKKIEGDFTVIIMGYIPN
ncbi:hypothetical protein SteCoe_9823 [Stentor coeruleus]|uniref:phosphatidylinositol-3,4,5-trisphosphate 3-phosphatase n=1 Tax=Stentor coeruleus TaxID=5963 RepID=A0A1R2CGU0_9CILI|nr:hypothetical protein SteCoe_9823 [Stentor coeruleus]